MVLYKLHYFPIKGRAEFIRYIFAQAGVQFEEKVVTFQEWNAGEKSKYLFDFLPVLELDGKQMHHSLVIGRYLADEFNLAGSTNFNKAWANMVAHSIEDIYSKGYGPIARATFSNDEKALKEAWGNLKNAIVDGLYEKLEKLLGSNKYFCGNELTWGDLYVAEFSERIDNNFEKGYMAKYPNLNRLMETVHKLPNIEKYVKSRPPLRA